MDPKGVLEMLLIFLEDRGDGVLSHPSLHSSTVSAVVVNGSQIDRKTFGTKSLSNYAVSIDTAYNF